ncbi:MAG: site-specific integrase [Phycisphaerales bacterium]|nr:site-specific integrase [Phycisphaerales bacterium]
MARLARQTTISSEYFTWILFQRPNGIFYADGRGNRCDLKRYSLDTSDRAEAIQTLKLLDLKMAINLGKASPVLLNAKDLLAIPDGIASYMTYVKRPIISGGTRVSSQKRYRAVFDKFQTFAAENHLTCWQAVTRNTIDAYGAWLEEQDYAYSTVRLELNTINQLFKHLVQDTKRLPASCYQPLKLRKSDDVTRYCYRSTEVEQMIAYCLQQPKLHWLAYVLTALATTGLRISELASLRWSDIQNGKLVLLDTSRRGTRKQRQQARTTKGGYTRSFPIHPDLQAVLDRLLRHPDGFLFHGPEGGRLKPDTVRLIFIREVITPLSPLFPTPPDELGFADGRLHSFRHYFCSQCADSNTPEQMLMIWLGHRDSRMVRHYYHLRDNTSVEHMHKLNLVGTASAALRQVAPLSETSTAAVSATTTEKGV